MMPRLPGPLVPALNQRFKSSCDYRVPASGRFARGTVLGGDHLGVLPHSTDFSHSFLPRGGTDDLIAFEPSFS